MDEKIRLGQVFDNWYYDGYSVTNSREMLDRSYSMTMLNDYLKWNKVFSAMNDLQFTDIPNYKILDAGCGNGNSLRKLIEFGANPSNCFGVDVSEKVLAFARETSPIGITYNQGYIDKMDFDTNSMDMIICFGVLIHILDNDYIRKISDEFKRVLKKGGLAFIIVSFEGTYWQESLRDATRNFNFAENELQTLFNQFQCLGVLDCYSDAYPKDVSPGQLISAFEQNSVAGVPFKLVVFRAE